MGSLFRISDASNRLRQRVSSRTSHEVQRLANGPLNEVNHRNRVDYLESAAEKGSGAM